MKVILNEREVAENILATQTKFRNVNTTIDLLIKYWNSQNKDKNYILSELDNFLRETHKSYNKVKWANRLNGTIDWHLRKNYNLVNVESVNITKNELDYIRGMDSIVVERLAFVMLVYAKILNQINPNNNNYVKNKMDEMFRCAKISGTMDKKYGYVNQIKEYGGVSRPVKVNSTSVSVDFIDENSDVEVCINDFREFVLEYLKWRGENIGRCEVCDIRMKLNSNRTLYCKECWKKKQKEWDRQYQSKKYISRVLENSRE